MSAIEQIEVSIETAKIAVEKRDALERLSKNPDFKLVIEDGYFVDESKRLVLIKATPAMGTPEHQENIIKAIDGIGSLFQYLVATTQTGGQMERSLKGDEITREELLEEQV